MSHAKPTPTRRALVAHAGALALLGSTVTAEAASHDETALIELGKQFEQAWADQRKLDYALNQACAVHLDDDEIWHRQEAAHDRTGRVVRQIEAISAPTLTGLIIKGRACWWTHGGEPIQPDYFATSRDAPTTDARLAASILQDLIAIGGKPMLTSQDPRTKIMLVNPDVTTR